MLHHQRQRHVSQMSEMTIPSTPSLGLRERQDESFSMMSSPASILLGFDDHIEVSSIKGRLLGLFGPPSKAVSPLPSTPERSQVSSVVREDPSLNDFGLDVMSSEVVKSTKRDSSHLELPTVAENENANTSRFQAPPSAFIKFTKTNSVRTIRNRAMNSQTYSSSIIPFGYAGVKKRRK